MSLELLLGLSIDKKLKQRLATTNIFRLDEIDLRPLLTLKGYHLLQPGDNKRSKLLFMNLEKLLPL